MLPMNDMASAKGTKLLALEPIGILLFILARGIVPALALRAR